MRPRFIVFAAVVGLALAAYVRADKVDKSTPGPVKPVSASAVPEPPPKPAPVLPTVTISGRDREAVYGYYGAKLTPAGCPAGLAKKGNGCLPDDGAQGNWKIGERLSSKVMVYPLPAVLLGQLYPANGYQYVRVGNDVLLLGVETRLVAGALADVEAN